MAEFNVAKYYNLTQKSYFDKLGKVSKIVGLTIESIGPDAKLNDLCVFIPQIMSPICMQKL